MRSFTIKLLFVGICFVSAWVGHRLADVRLPHGRAPLSPHRDPRLGAGGLRFVFGRGWFTSWGHGKNGSSGHDRL